MGEEEWSADLAGIWESRPRPDRRGMYGRQPACFTFMSEISVTPPEYTLTAPSLMYYILLIGRVAMELFWTVQQNTSCVVF